MFIFFLPGGVLLSRDPAVQVPSALKTLTSVFGMGTGVTFSPSPPDFVPAIYFATLRQSSLQAHSLFDFLDSLVSNDYDRITVVRFSRTHWLYCAVRCCALLFLTVLCFVFLALSDYNLSTHACQYSHFGRILNLGIFLYLRLSLNDTLSHIT